MEAIAENVSSLVLSVVLPLSTMAAVAIACGDSRPSAHNRRKKPNVPAPGKGGKRSGSVSSSRKHGSHKRGGAISSSSKRKHQPGSQKGAKQSIKEGAKKVSSKLNSAKEKTKKTISEKLPDMSKEPSGKSMKPESKKGNSATSIKFPSAEEPKPSSRNAKQPSKTVSCKEKKEPSKSHSVSRSAQPINVRMEPEQLAFKSNGGLQQITVHNKDPKRRALKVKCSDNGLYRVNPVCAFLEPGKSLSLNVYRNSSAPEDIKTDKLVLVVASASKEEKDPWNVFVHKKKYPMMVMPMYCSAANAAPDVSGPGTRCVCVK